MRAVCLNCARKHLAKAIARSMELPEYDGNVDDDHWWGMVAQLSEAEDHLRKEYPILADSIRDDRKAIEEDHDTNPRASYAVLATMDFNKYIVEINEIAATLAG